MGLASDLVLVNDYGNDYAQPVRDHLNDLVAGSHLCGRVGVPGGAYLIEGHALTRSQRSLLEAAAAIVVRGGNGGLDGQLREALSALPPFRHVPPVRRKKEAACPEGLLLDNGWGGFSEEGYVIYRTPAPMPWCNVLCNRELGCLVSERGGGFTWYRNSYSGRLTPFRSDPVGEGLGDLIVLRAPDGTEYSPAAEASRIVHRPGGTRFEGGDGRVAWELTQFVDHELPVKCHRLKLTAAEDGEWKVCLRIDWLLGSAQADKQMTFSGGMGNICWARGSVGGLAFACFPGFPGEAKCGEAGISLSLRAGRPLCVDALVGVAEDAEQLRTLPVRWLTLGGGEARRAETDAFWREFLGRVEFVTPDPMVNRMLNGFLPYQVICARLWGRTGWYQAGGAYGFRDQLQDMLALLPIDPRAVRDHLLLAAAHQFQSGDVMHWWHPERTGVRTRISDDLLFLPYVAAQYVAESGDREVLEEQVFYLRDVDIPDDRDDWYGEAEVSGETDTLRGHCLRAIGRALRTGEHGLLLMGGGDWNDGLNRVGREGRGESVWLTEFMIVVLERFAPLCPEETRLRFSDTAARLREAVEANAWDGRWYRRAYTDDGRVLGGEQSEGGCRIDALAQSWAVMAGLSRERARMAMGEVERRLYDRENGLIRLLTPPFEHCESGYIGGYPPGVRENGGQYTHAACWVAAAFAGLGEGQKAWDAFRMLLPYTHADTEEKAARYRVEPYVMAADIYGEAPYAGRGGWTWYTGAAGWMLRTAYASLMGVRRRGEYVTMRALLPAEWNEASVCLRIGGSVYRLTCRRDCGSPLLDSKPVGPEGVRIEDDGQEHEAVFPCREEESAGGE